MKKRFLAVFMMFAMVFIATAYGQGSSDNAVTVGQTWVITDDNPLDGGNACKPQSWHD